jgi:glucosamine-6-phosphate deaminase
MGGGAEDALRLKSLADVSLPTFLFDTREDPERVVAAEIVALSRAKNDCVLGLPTGNTPIGVYRDLIRAQRAGEVSFARATAFNLDEFLDIERGHAASFERWMEANLFAHVDFERARRRIPALRAGVTDPHAVARDYESAIGAAGGIDLLLLGIGRNGHIGFNEPGSALDTRTRVVDLHPDTRTDAAAAFGGLERVPTRAITMGVATILDARRIRVLAFGARKAQIVQRTLFDTQSSACPATFLRGHADVKLFVDYPAAAMLPTA